MSRVDEALDVFIGSRRSFGPVSWWRRELHMNIAVAEGASNLFVDDRESFRPVRRWRRELHIKAVATNQKWVRWREPRVPLGRW